MTGLVYEIVWIRLFSIAFGNTAQALSTVLSVFLGGLALGAFLAAKANPARPLRLYGVIEIATGLYAIAIPWLIQATQPILRALYGTGHSEAWTTAAVRVVLCSVVLMPATVLMGATLPLLAGWVSATSPADAGPRVGILYTVNLVGASAGALLSGFASLPALGFTRTLQLACTINAVIGVVGLALARGEAPIESAPRIPQKRTDTPMLPTRVWITVSFLGGAICMLYEVAWSRTYGLLFGPTASTVTLVLATFLAGLALGGVVAGKLRNNLIVWLCGAQFVCAALLLWTFVGAGAAPQQVAEWVQSHSAEPTQIEWMKVTLLAATLLPLTIAIGLIFPLILRFRPASDLPMAKRIGGLYGINTAGCICGSLLTGWMLIPFIGTERTLFLGGLLNLGVGLLVFQSIKPRRMNLAYAAAGASVLLAVFLVPRWNMAALTAGAYKYAPYYSTSYSTTGDPFNREEVAFLREGKSGTVAVRKAGGSMLLSIDGKVDASDAGGDLLTEKLLAHLPLMLTGGARKVCLIGLASGVTAGSALTHSLETLDVVEISSDVVEASRFFARVNHEPLADPRTTLILNDGRNHLTLTSSKYDVIISEPSNPWIAGMNSLFSRDFFRIARGRLNPGGVFAQWFHIYNLPQDDLQSLFRAFQDVFSSAILWQLNDGDVLLTGFADDAVPKGGAATLSRAAAADLASVGVTDPKLLLNMYVMRDQDIRRFAAAAAPDTDDDPRLEFHGQRDLHAQTDLSNADDLAAFSRTLTPPGIVDAVRNQLTSEQSIANAAMFERAESYRSAFRAYQVAFRANPHSREALAGMDRCARLPQERSAVALALNLPEASQDTLEKRTELALAKAQQGDVGGAEFLFEENAQAHPLDSAARFNYGLFCLERKNYPRAIEQFRQSIDLNPKYLPAYEAMAESYLQLHDTRNAAEWSRRILQIDPTHAVARQTLATLEHR